MNTQNPPEFNPVIVECLRILARRGRAIREAEERATADCAMPGSDSQSAATATEQDAQRNVIISRIRAAASALASGGAV